MIELGRLKALWAVAQYGTVTAAAGLLHCTPSAISQHLAKLERETGSVLVEKDGRGLRLTGAGRVLADQAALVLAAVEEAESALAAHHRSLSGPVRLAAFPTACRGLLPHALTRLASRYPELALTLRESDPRVSLDLLRQGEIDVALVDDWPEVALEFRPGISHTELGLDVADLVVPAGHELAAAGPRAPVRLTDVRNQRWIASTPGAICHDWLLRVLPGVKPDFLVGEFETQLTLIAAGLGIALIPRLARTPLPAGVVVLPVEPAPARRVTATWRSASGARPVVGVAVAALRAAWESSQAL
jgi:DNA-binding transcriptional LysR family regulator